MRSGSSSGISFPASLWSMRNIQTANSSLSSIPSWSISERAHIRRRTEFGSFDFIISSRAVVPGIIKDGDRGKDQQVYSVHGEKERAFYVHSHQNQSNIIISNPNKYRYTKPVFCSLVCIVNANRRTNNRVGLGTRLRLHYLYL